MTTKLFDYPKTSACGRNLPKSKIFENANPSTAIKDLFNQQVKKITWDYKLAPETINLPQTMIVPEFQILRIDLKESELKHDVLRCIDKAIPSPIIFELHFENKIKIVAAYKQTKEVDSSKCELSNYFETCWVSKDKPRQPLPIVLDLEKLYVYLLNSLMPFSAHSNEGLTDRIDRTELIVIKQKELEKCKAKLHKEKQFNRKVEINFELRTLQQQLVNLTRT